MPEVVVNGVKLFYVEKGEGTETVVFSHSFLVDHSHFDAQIEALSRQYRVLAFDHRDHGRSERMSRDYGMEEIYADGLGFVEAVVQGPCHWIGLSTGGFVGLRLAIRRPELLRSLVVMDSSADRDPWRKRVEYSFMFTILGLAGFGPLSGRAMQAMFSPRFLHDPARREARKKWERLMTSGDRRAVIRFGRAIMARESVVGDLHRIDMPTLFVVGEHDAAIPAPRVRATAERVRGAQLEIVPNAGHLCTIEEPELVNALLESFLLGRHA